MWFSFYCIRKFFTIIKFLVHYLTSVFVTFMVTFHIKSFFYWYANYFTYLKVFFKSLIWYTKEIFYKIFNIIFRNCINSFTILKLWQGLQNASLQYLQLTKNLLCQDSQALFWQYQHFNISTRFSFRNLSNSSFSMSVLKNFHLLSLKIIFFLLQIFFW